MYLSSRPILIKVIKLKSADKVVLFQDEVSVEPGSRPFFLAWDRSRKTHLWVSIGVEG